MKYTASGRNYYATEAGWVYLIQRPAPYQSEWAAFAKRDEAGSPWHAAPHTYPTMREAKAWAAEHAAN